MKTIRKSLHSFLPAIVCLFMSGCLYYDYGVDKSVTKLPHRSYYYRDKDRKIDFVTVLYTLDEELAGPNYTEFTVRITHMQKERFRKKHKGKYLSTIVFGDFTTEDAVRIIPESVRLVHKTRQGKTIPPEKTEYDFSHDPGVKHRSHYYRKVYDPSRLPDELIEFVFLEVLVDGEKKTIEYEFPIKKELHYTCWDVIMGV